MPKRSTKPAEGTLSETELANRKCAFGTIDDQISHHGDDGEGGTYNEQTFRAVLHQSAVAAEGAAGARAAEAALQDMARAAVDAAAQRDFCEVLRACAGPAWLLPEDAVLAAHLPAAHAFQRRALGVLLLLLETCEHQLETLAPVATGAAQRSGAELAERFRARGSWAFNGEALRDIGWTAQQLKHLDISQMVDLSQLIAVTHSKVCSTLQRLAEEWLPPGQLRVPGLQELRALVLGVQLSA